jgi:uncharacterized protein (TIGR03083 family)
VSKRDLVKVRRAYLEQWDVLVPWWKKLTTAEWLTRSTIPGWLVGDLVAHFGLVADTLDEAARQPNDELGVSVGDYCRRYGDVAADIDRRTREEGSGDRERVLSTVVQRGERAAQGLRSPTMEGDPIVAARRGPIRWSDFVVTRIIELVVHGDDLARSTPQKGGPTIQRSALQITVRALADMLAGQDEGRSVEVRVPPFAAVQCVAGPRHTRGTPGAVVEMDPFTFVRLAAGRISWDAAVADGRVLASGQRAELAEHFPLFR